MKTLRMKFETDGASSYTLSLGYCREDLTLEEVQTAMESIKANPIFTFGLTAIAGADIVDRNVTELV